MNWLDTSLAPSSLSAARLQLHYGAWIVGSTAHSVLQHAADDSHANFAFDADRGSLATRELAPGLRLHLDVVEFELVLRADRDTLASVPLDGRSFAELLQWAGEALAQRGINTKLERREFPDFPASPILEGAAFDKPSEAMLAELCRWYSNASALFESVRGDQDGMSEVRIWPHHFDMGALISVSADGAQSIGIGLSPGDDHFDQPYFYCSPYPAPSAGAALPALAAGGWTTDGFVSAILTANDIQAAESQGGIAQQYLPGAIARCRELLTGAVS